MTYYKASIEVLISVDNEAEACDAISEAIRPLLKSFSRDNENHTAWVDWRYADGHSIPTPHDGSGFEYA